MKGLHSAIDYSPRGPPPYSSSQGERRDLIKQAGFSPDDILSFAGYGGAPGRGMVGTGEIVEVTQLLKYLFPGVSSQGDAGRATL